MTDDPQVEFPHTDLHPPRPAARDRDGRPIDLAELEAMWERPQNRVVAFTSVVDPDGVRQAVSTIWLGIDHAFEGEPLIYETAVFDGAGLLQRARHPDEAHALSGHLDAVLQLMSGNLQPRPVAEQVVTASIPTVAPEATPAPAPAPDEPPAPEAPLPQPAPSPTFDEVLDLDRIAEDLEAAHRARTAPTPIQEGTPDDQPHTSDR